VSDRGEEEIEEEVTNPLVSVHRAVWRSVAGRVRSLRQQAPGARMVGEFAVKHAVREAQKKFAGGASEPSQARDTTPTPNDQSR
jgi:hypothetical protein